MNEALFEQLRDRKQQEARRSAAARGATRKCGACVGSGESIVQFLSSLLPDPVIVACPACGGAGLA